MKKIEDINKYIKFFHENKNVKYKNELSIKSDNKLQHWGLGIGDWGLGIGDWAQSPIPNPQSPK